MLSSLELDDADEQSLKQPLPGSPGKSPVPSPNPSPCYKKQNISLEIDSSISDLVHDAKPPQESAPASAAAQKVLNQRPRKSSLKTCTPIDVHAAPAAAKKTLKGLTASQVVKDGVDKQKEVESATGDWEKLDPPTSPTKFTGPVEEKCFNKNN